MGLAGHPRVVRHGVDHVHVLAGRVNTYGRIGRASMDYVRGDARSAAIERDNNGVTGDGGMDAGTITRRELAQLQRDLFAARTAVNQALPACGGRLGPLRRCGRVVCPVGGRVGVVYAVGCGDAFVPDAPESTMRYTMDFRTTGSTAEARVNPATARQHPPT
jgi:hypothetical protein